MPTYLKYGLSLGAFSILLQLTLYLINPSLLFDWKIGLGIGVLFSCLFIFLAQKEMKQADDGFLSFGEAFVVGWKTYALGTLLATLFTFVLYNFIDSSLGDLQKEYSIELVEEMAESFNFDDEVLEAQIEAIEEKDVNSNIGELLLGWGIIILTLGSILSAIMAAISKNGRSDNPLA